MSGIWAKWFRVYAVGGIIIGSGVLLFKYTTPTDEELIERLSPELRQQYEREKNLRQAEQQTLMKIVQETAKSNDPIWKTGPIKSPFERDTSTLQNRDQFQKVKANEIQKEELERVRQELDMIRQKSQGKTKAVVDSKSWWKPW
ncbi:HHR032Cp [Eremothecium sinecaudum]|uniref:Cytochrome b mRNA-processing protein 4 n=1 Tax=Eremothecium sinecaudum TaxID=45286 RepID=A0A120K2W5_9SACH|nr:HHR032Cp [Eremothecium sinecaudum]AMD22801.1 HHR032Cp [Eremothecium sinecaudum]